MYSLSKHLHDFRLQASVLIILKGPTSPKDKFQDMSSWISPFLPATWQWRHVRGPTGALCLNAMDSICQTCRYRRLRPFFDLALVLGASPTVILPVTLFYRYHIQPRTATFPTATTYTRYSLRVYSSVVFSAGMALNCPLATLLVRQFCLSSTASIPVWMI